MILDPYTKTLPPKKQNLPLPLTFLRHISLPPQMKHVILGVMRLCASPSRLWLTAPRRPICRKESRKRRVTRFRSHRALFEFRSEGGINLNFNSYLIHPCLVSKWCVHPLFGSNKLGRQPLTVPCEVTRLLIIFIDCFGKHVLRINKVTSWWINFCINRILLIIIN